MIIKKIPFYLTITILILPLSFTYMSPANNSIITFILIMADIVTITNVNRKMVYLEYMLLKGNSPNTVKQHLWLVCVIMFKIIQLICLWTFTMSVHIYSPFFSFKISHRMFIIYTSIILYYLLEGVYFRMYKKWVITYNAVSTNDTEMSLTIT